MFKSELYKAFHNKGTYFVLLLGGVIAALAFFMDAQIGVILGAQGQDAVGLMYREKTDTGVNIYSQWIGMRSSVYQYVLFFLMPLLCVMPHGVSYCRDMKSGYVNQILTRTTHKNYYSSKLLSVMISGGVVCAFPLIINFIMCMCMFPFTEVVAGTRLFHIFDKNVLSELFFNHAILYLCIYILFVFFYMGVVAAIALGITCLDQNTFIVMSAPFIVLFALHTVCTWLLGNEMMSPMRITAMNTIQSSDLGGIFLEILILILLTVPFIVKLFKKKEDIV